MSMGAGAWMVEPDGAAWAGWSCTQRMQAHPPTARQQDLQREKRPITFGHAQPERGAASFDLLIRGLGSESIDANVSLLDAYRNQFAISVGF